VSASDIKGKRTFAGSVTGMIQVTPSDDTDLGNAYGLPPTNLLLTEEGAVTVEDLFGNEITFPAGGLAVGVFHRIQCRKVLETGTDSITIIVGWDN